MSPRLPQRVAPDRLLVLATMLRPIARLLMRHGIGVGELLEAAKRAYVESAIAEITAPGRRPNISRLSVMTGLTRKDIANLIGTYYMGGASAVRRTPQQRALRVLRGWLLDPEFSGSGGRPADLSPSEGKATFAALVRKYGGDVTPVAVLSELERMRAISRTKSRKLRITSRSLLRSLDPEVREFAQSIEDFAESLTDSGDGDRPPVFRGFQDVKLGSADLVALFKTTFAKRSVALLEGVKAWAASHHTSKKEARTRVGVGVYVVEKPATSSRQPRGLRAIG
jgi:hypothetical protein